MKKTLFFVLLGLTATAIQADELMDSLSMPEVVVTGTRSAVDVRHLPMTVTVIGRKTLTEQHQTSILPTVMQQVPGFFVTSRGMMGYGVSGGAAGGINLRGISGGTGQLMVLIDGHPQYQGIYGHPIADSYQTLMAERVEVLRGPASVLYGSNAMGGVVNIVTRQSNQDGIYTHINLGAGSWGTIQTEASNQIRQGRFSSTVAVQYNRTDNHRPRMGFEQYGGYAKIGYDLNRNWKAYADVNVNHFNASNPTKVSDDGKVSPLYDADQWITRGMASVGLENHYGKASGALSVYTNFGKHKIDDGTDNPTNPTKRYFRSKDALTGVSVYESVQLFPGNRVTAGVDYQHIYGHAYYTSKATGDVMDTPNKQSGESHRDEVAGYVEVRQDIVNWLTVDAGLRVDYHSITGTEWIPQAGLVARPNSTSEVKAMVSKGFRNPTMREMYLYPPSNTELKPERLWNYELSWCQRTSDLTYGANIYYIKGDNMIQTVNKKNVNTGEIENWGVEVHLKYPIGNHFNLTWNSSYLHMKNKIVAAPKVMDYWGIDYHCGKWFANLGLQHIKDLYTFVGANETKERFWLLSANVNYQATKNIALWARGENLLAQKYEINLGYPMPRATFMGGVNVTF